MQAVNPLGLTAFVGRGVDRCRPAAVGSKSGEFTNFFFFRDLKTLDIRLNVDYIMNSQSLMTRRSAFPLIMPTLIYIAGTLSSVKEQEVLTHYRGLSHVEGPQSGFLCFLDKLLSARRG